MILFISLLSFQSSLSVWSWRGIPIGAKNNPTVEKKGKIGKQEQGHTNRSEATPTGARPHQLERGHTNRGKGLAVAQLITLSRVAASLFPRFNKSE